MATAKGVDAPTAAVEEELETEVRESTILKLTTSIEPADPVEIDGERYEMLGYRHLSDRDEAEVVALLARYENLSMQLATTNDDKEAISIATKLRQRRISLLSKLTTIPKELIQKLPPPEQIKLVRAVQEERDEGSGDTA